MMTLLSHTGKYFYESWSLISKKYGMSSFWFSVFSWCSTSTDKLCLDMRGTRPSLPPRFAFAHKTVSPQIFQRQPETEAQFSSLYLILSA